MISLNDLTYIYEHQPMRFSLSISAGVRVAMLGPSGAGKRTLLGGIAGFLMADTGVVTLAGVDHTHTPPSNRAVSMLFEENNLFSHLSFEQNLGLGLDAGLRLNRRMTARRQTPWLEKVGV